MFFKNLFHQIKYSIFIRSQKLRILKVSGTPKKCNRVFGCHLRGASFLAVSEVQGRLSPMTLEFFRYKT